MPVIKLSSLTPNTAPGFTVRVTVAEVRCAVSRGGFPVCEVILADGTAQIAATFAGNAQVQLAARAGAVLLLRRAHVLVNRAGYLRLEVGSCGAIEADDEPAHAPVDGDAWRALPDLSAQLWELAECNDVPSS